MLLMVNLKLAVRENHSQNGSFLKAAVSNRRNHDSCSCSQDVSGKIIEMGERTVYLADKKFKGLIYV